MNLKEEQNIFRDGFNLVGGIDEAGRGPLAGPVVAACVILRPDFEANDSFSLVKIVRDSKKMTPRKREEVFEIIKNELEFGIGICDHKIIDRINILQATFLAMKKALSALKEKPEFILVDGKLIVPNLSIKQKAIVDGDRLVFSIAAASIIAKVTRDRIMREMHKLYPNYGFDKHKGYGTKMHLANLKKFGPSPIHRRSFEPVRILNKS